MLNWTGERYIPEMEPGIIHYEHLHRYKFAKEFVEDKTVLDLACGEGYGSFLMADVAKKVVGVDIDKETIEHASLKYSKNNLEFVVGSMTDIPLPGEKLFDVIICFEAIEHIREHDELMKEIKRLLKESGILVISTPNTYIYSRKNSPDIFQNPFHLKEMGFKEFGEVLKNNFKEIFIYGQKIYPVSNIFPVFGGDKSAEITEYCIEKEEKEFSFVDFNKKEAVYFIALVSNSLIPKPKLGSYLIDISETVFKRKDFDIDFLKNTLKEKDKEAAILAVRSKETEAEFAKVLYSKNEEITGLHKLEAGLVEDIRYKNEALAEFKEAEARLVETLQSKNKEIADMKETGVKLAQNIEDKNEEIIKLREEKSNFYRIVQDKDIQLNRAMAVIKENDSRAMCMTQLAGERELEIDQLNRELNNIKKSISWRFSQGFEKVVFFFLPENFKLRSFYKVLIKRSQNFFDKEKISHKKLVFKKNETPEVSVIIPAYNNFEYTYNCLSSLLENEKEANYEVIIADDCSSDETKNIKKYAENIKILRNEKNLGFVENCNRAADFAFGKYLLFLNNDTRILENSVSHLSKIIKKDDNIGATGGKIILPDGSLQEAGSIIWKDGSAKGYGRGDDPSKPEYNFIREVDYCSGAFLMIRKELFLKFGRFDLVYSPGYYEETDFCFTLQKNGYKTVYQPLAEIIHYETVTIGKGEAFNFQKKNSEIFKEKWKEKLAGQQDFGSDLKARVSLPARLKKNILYIDDRAPDPKLGSGYPRTYAVLNRLSELGFNITFYPAESLNGRAEISRYLQEKGIEMAINAGGTAEFDSFLSNRKNYYDIIFISRPHNMEKMAGVAKKHNPKSFLIYDAEAIFALRTIAYAEISGEKLSKKEKEKKIMAEVSLCKDADRVITVSENEKKIFEKYGLKESFIISHESPLKMNSKNFKERSGLLFVGGIIFDGAHNPNLDAILYFINKIFPLVREKVHCDFFIAGQDKTDILKKLEIEGVRWLGCVEDLSECYNNSKIFIAPTRFSAGVPLKMIEAASFGIPIVASKIVASQLNWRDGIECLVGENPQEFAEKISLLYSDAELWNAIRKNSTERIKKEYNSEVFLESVRKAFDTTTA